MNHDRTVFAEVIALHCVAPISVQFCVFSRSQVFGLGFDRTPFSLGRLPAWFFQRGNVPGRGGVAEAKIAKLFYLNSRSFAGLDFRRGNVPEGGSREEPQKNEVERRRRNLQQRCVFFYFPKFKFKIVSSKCPRLAAVPEPAGQKKGHDPRVLCPTGAAKPADPASKVTMKGANPYHGTPRPSREGQGH